MVPIARKSFSLVSFPQNGSDIDKVELELPKYNSKILVLNVTFNAFKEYVEKRNENHDVLTSFYFNKSWRQHRFWTYVERKRS